MNFFDAAFKLASGFALIYMAVQAMVVKELVNGSYAKVGNESRIAELITYPSGHLMTFVINQYYLVYLNGVLHWTMTLVLVSIFGYLSRDLFPDWRELYEILKLALTLIKICWLKMWHAVKKMFRSRNRNQPRLRLFVIVDRDHPFENYLRHDSGNDADDDTDYEDDDELMEIELIEN